jgi:hypothetical protein
VVQAWRERRPGFMVFASQVVLDEAAAGDPHAAGRRMQLLEGMPLLDLTPEVADLAAALIMRLPLPQRAGADAAHIANAELRPRIERICREQGYSVPVLCTPDELMGEAS